MHKLIISTGMCSDAEGEESYYPQVGGVSSSSSFQDIYWRCVCLFFASSTRHNPDAAHRLFVNRPGIPDIGTFKTYDFLSKLSVEVEVVPFTYAPPPNYYGAWRSTFYLLDIIKHISAHSRPGEQYVITDSDCLFIKDTERLTVEIERHGILTYDTHFPPEEDANGLTRLDLQKIYEGLTEQPVRETPGYCGGEIFAGTSEAIRQFSAEIDPVWQDALTRHAERRIHFNTEEHFLSYIVYKLGYPVGSANSFIRRIWTQRKLRAARQSDFDLTIWHVPAEKKYGLRKLFREMGQPNSRFWTTSPGTEFAQYLAPFLGIPRSSPLKRTEDLLDAVGWQIHSRVILPFWGPKRAEPRKGNTLIAKK